MSGHTCYCDNCGKELRLTEQRFQRKNHFCSKKCEGEFRKLPPNTICPICGKEFYLKPYMKKKAKHKPCCSYECLGEYRKTVYLGENNPNYGNTGVNNPMYIGKKTSSYGYTLISMPDHPFANGDGYVFEHRLVAEKYLLNDTNSVEIDGKRYLSKDFEVHHIDHNRKNNDPDNLLVLTKTDHAKLHAKERRLASLNSEKSKKPKSA